MGIQGLRLTVVLGVLITAVSGTGIFATFSDRVVSGNNTVVSGERPKAVDIVLANATSSGDAVDCGQWSHQLITGFFHLEDIQPVEVADADVSYACLKNFGAVAINVEAKAIDLVDIDMACTGDEAAAGDTTCGEQHAGELAPALAVQMSLIDCQTGAGSAFQARSLADWVTYAGTLPNTLAPDETACLKIQAWIPASNPETQLQQAQSDEVDWQFAFDAVEAS